MGLQNCFFKLVCEEVDAFGKNIIFDENMGNLEAVHEFVKDKVFEYPNAKWELYFMHVLTK